ncbi:MAG: cysteine hydrolase [Oscillospiraceae bacterium]|nr:cysteine hydrolase [Oscillospiraceae bacterium]
MKLIVMDMQKGLMGNELYNFDHFLENTGKVLRAARENGIEVIYVQHDDGPGSGLTQGDEAFEIAEQVAPQAGEKIFTKNHGSCFGNKDFTKYLEDAGDDTLIIMGLLTNFCVNTTVQSAFERGYKVLIPEGTNSTFDNQYMTGETAYKFFNEATWADYFAKCLSVEETIARMKKQKP